LHRPIRAVAMSDDALANVARIQAIWAECHQRYGKHGPFLFGAFSGADAMFAPVVHRFRTYAIPVADNARHYVHAMDALPAFREWTRDGLAETLLIDRLEAI
jgi:glutathione S-transferase